MNHNMYMQIISGEAKGALPAAARASLHTLSAVYATAWAIREAAFALHLLPVTRIPARVISIGNITAGGTGKTPAIIYFATRLHEDSAKVAVLSRGYRRRSKTDEPVVVSTPEGKVLASPEIAGDEPFLLARKLPGIPVIVCANRVKAATMAVAQFGAEVILLDDGFQHRRIFRDQNIVTIDCSEPFGFGHLLPRGLLREPLRALKRATMFLLTRVDERKHADLVEKLREINPVAEILLSRHRSTRLIAVKSRQVHPCIFLNGKRIFAVSSIGNPASFEHAVRKLGAQLAGSLRFPDHYWYSAADVLHIRDAARQSGAEYIVATEKDAVRLQRLSEVPENLLLLEMKLEIIGDYPCA